MVGGSRSTWREPTYMQGEHAKSTQEVPIFLWDDSVQPHRGAMIAYFWWLIAAFTVMKDFRLTAVEFSNKNFGRQANLTLWADFFSLKLVTIIVHSQKSCKKSRKGKKNYINFLMKGILRLTESENKTSNLIKQLNNTSVRAVCFVCTEFRNPGNQ